MNWLVYMLECSDNTLYTGITNNLDNRLAKHNAGQGAKYTKYRLPVKVVWQTTVAMNKSTALKLEHKIKSMSKKNKLKIINGDI